MNSRILSRRDLDFLLYEWLEAESLAERSYYSEHSKETFDAALNASQKIAIDYFSTHCKKNDQNEPTFDGEQVHIIPEVGKALDVYAKAGLLASRHDYNLGGMQLPALIADACSVWFTAANIGTSSYSFLTVANANLLLAYGSAEQIDMFVRPMLCGRFFGTMCLSETQAGSSLSDIKTRAVRDGVGRYRVFGSKMWISGGEHELSENIVHLVLAKISVDGKELPEGVNGISLFIVPKSIVLPDGTISERNDVALVGLNHKMGYRGTTNCLLNFGEGKFKPYGNAGAVAYLVGEPGKGLAQMFHMMNEARIAVGFNATALGYTGYLHSLDYARTRVQGRHPANKDPRSPQVHIIEHADVKRMLLAQKSYVEGALALCLYCSRLVDDVKTLQDEKSRREAELLLEILTPIAKSWPSQWCLEANSIAIQVHGGYGYARDYSVEQFYRDNRLNSIHEGTHGIQALDLLKRKVTMENGTAFKLLVTRIQSTIEHAIRINDDIVRANASYLCGALQRLIDVTITLWKADDISATLSNATIYLEAFGHVVIAWVWLEQALVVWDKSAIDDGFYLGKMSAFKYFFKYELPKVQPMFDLLESLDMLTVEMAGDWF